MENKTKKIFLMLTIFILFSAIYNQINFSNKKILDVRHLGSKSNIVRYPVIFPKLADTDYLEYDEYAQKAGWAENNINWQFSTNPVQIIEVWALDSSNYITWSLGGSATGYLLSEQSSDSGTFIVPYGDNWHIVFWNTKFLAEATLVSYSASFYGDTRPASIEVTRPWSSKTYNIGESDLIKWNSINAGSSVKIELYKGNSLYEELYSSTSNDGEQSWTVPNSCPSGSDYQIKVSSLSTSAYDYSDYFIINHYYIQVTRPTNESVVIPRTYCTIEWDANVPSDGVDIYLYLNSEEIQSIWIARDNTGTHIWEVGTYLGDTPSSDYRIKIEDKWDRDIFGFSDFFTITETKHITIVTPSAGSSYMPNDFLNMTWITNTPCETVEIILEKNRINGEYVTTIDSAAVNSGNYSWLIPSDLPFSDKYYFYIRATDGSCFDFSDDFVIGSSSSLSVGYNIVFALLVISIISIIVIIKKSNIRILNCK
jgi:hypothetical protein